MISQCYPVGQVGILAKISDDPILDMKFPLWLEGSVKRFGTVGTYSSTYCTHLSR
jgi:hypothetical protein